MLELKREELSAGVCGWFCWFRSRFDSCLCERWLLMSHWIIDSHQRGAAQGKGCFYGCKLSQSCYFLDISLAKQIFIFFFMCFLVWLKCNFPCLTDITMNTGHLFKKKRKKKKTKKLFLYNTNQPNKWIKINENCCVLCLDET